MTLVSCCHLCNFTSLCLSSSQAEQLSARSDGYLWVGSWLDAAGSAIPARVNGQCHPWHLCPLWDATIDSAPGHLESQVLRPDEPGLSCRKPRVTVDARSLTNTDQVTLKLISSTTTLYGLIHLNQSCYWSNMPRWWISLRSKYPLCFLHLSLPASPQASILLSVPSCSGAALLPLYLCGGRPFRTEGFCQG